MAEYSVALTIITILVIGDLVLSDHMRNVISTVSSVLPGH